MALRLLPNSENMKLHRILLLWACALCFSPGYAQEKDAPHGPKPHFVKLEKAYKFRVSFTDKKNSGFSVKHPEQFLSEKSIERRKRYGLKVDEFDLPISPTYLESLRESGLKIHNSSKWNNSAVVETTDSALAVSLSALPFVREVRCVWVSPDSLRAKPLKKNRRDQVTNLRDTTAHFYGHAKRQVEMLGVDSLHAMGFRGEGITIAVIDGGFYNADALEGLKGAKILGTRNFVRPQKSVYEELSHGTNVLACMAANIPYFLVGTAPEASFYLLVSEDGETEQLVEEDNWCAAVEYADSLGVDLITSSLGYYTFDHDYMSHKYYELDGKTAANSKVASLAASRGILMLNSAGNSGDDRWKKIGFPADAPDILTVGAVDSLKTNANFSSLGHSADGRVKPDVMALGQAAATLETDGTLDRVNGTSFSTPIMCGAVACLKQAFPKKKVQDIIQAVRQSGDNAARPDNVYGYGIPDFVKAFELLE